MVLLLRSPKLAFFSNTAKFPQTQGKPACLLASKVHTQRIGIAREDYSYSRTQKAKGSEKKNLRTRRKEQRERQGSFRRGEGRKKDRGLVRPHGSRTEGLARQKPILFAKGARPRRQGAQWTRGVSLGGTKSYKQIGDRGEK